MWLVNFYLKIFQDPKDHNILLPIPHDSACLRFLYRNWVAYLLWNNKKWKINICIAQSKSITFSQQTWFSRWYSLLLRSVMVVYFLGGSRAIINSWSISNDLNFSVILKCLLKLYAITANLFWQFQISCLRN